MLDMPNPHLHANPPYKWLYITPLLSEVDRIKEACRNLHIQDPVRELAEQANGPKYPHLLELIRHGRNIVSTHALFSYLNEDATLRCEGVLRLPLVLILRCEGEARASKERTRGRSG
jgi:hypothetical protein